MPINRFIKIRDWSRTGYISALLLLLGLLFLGIGGYSYFYPHIISPSSSILQDVINRGYLRCGVNRNVRGFSVLSNKIEDPRKYSEEFNNESEIFASGEGFDADFCKAVALTVFGSLTAQDGSSNIIYIALNSEERLQAVADRDIDLLARNTTHTVGRDMMIDFARPNYHDVQKIMVKGNKPDNALEHLKKAKICVLQASTTFINLQSFLKRNKLMDVELIIEDPYSEWKNTDNVRDSYSKSGSDSLCDAWVADESQLLGFLTGVGSDEEEISEKAYEKRLEEHSILNVEISSFEPLAPAVPEGDSQWLDIVNTTLWVLISAEELGIYACSSTDESNVEGRECVQFIGDSLTDVTDQQKDLLGRNSNLNIGSMLGCGINDNFGEVVISNLGNYGQIYARHFAVRDELLDRDRGRNKLYRDGGLVSSPPFRVDGNVTIKNGC